MHVIQILEAARTGLWAVRENVHLNDDPFFFRSISNNRTTVPLPRIWSEIKYFKVKIHLCV